MDNITVLVLADPTARELAMLESLPGTTNIVVGNTREAFERAAEHADVILSWSKSGELLRQVWRMSPGVRWVHSRSAGLDGILFDELIHSSVPLTNGRGVFSAALSEFVMAAILFFAKDLRRMVRSQMAGVWDPFNVEDVSRQTVGIIGYGDIGHAVATCARGLGMRVLALRRRAELSHGDPLIAEAFPSQRRLELLANSDYVVLSAPLTKETRGMIAEAEFEAMRPGAVLINIGRGPLVKEAALVRALEQKRIRGAALDVFEHEPLPEGHPFYRLDNVLLSPHSADNTADWLERSMKCFIDNFERFRKGEPLLNVVDKSAGY